MNYEYNIFYKSTVVSENGDKESRECGSQRRPHTVDTDLLTTGATAELYLNFKQSTSTYWDC